VNLFIRELQSAADFISSAHKVIEIDFAAAELVAKMQEEIKELPSQYLVSGSESDSPKHTFGMMLEELELLLDKISASEALKALNEDLFDSVNKAFVDTSQQFEITEEFLANKKIDLDTLIERAIFVDKALEGMASALNTLALELRKQLQIAVDRERQIHNRPTIAGAIIGGFTILVLVACAWLYVDRIFVRRLTDLSKSMLEIAGGNLRAALPSSKGGDEVADMANALRIFRDTAVEVEENNLREVAESQQRLVDAIESISEGFCIFDREGRLILSNRRYQSLMSTGNQDIIQPGVTFSTIAEKIAKSGLIPDAETSPQKWISDRIKQHENPGTPFTQARSDGTWLEVTEYKTTDGGTVAIYTDITDRKKSEQTLLESKLKIEKANEMVIQKNIMLESLSTKLSKYLSPQIYSSIFSGRQDVEIASKRKKLTVLFSDIGGFTEASDTLESEELTELLNSYLTEMSRIALDHGATIDKYIGDAIMAFFGDPESKGLTEDAVSCVKMAMSMQNKMLELRQVWLDQGIENPFQLRIGINTGYCTVGNFGSEDRMDYTIIGNEVNLAARLQTQAELGEILISHETYSLVKELVLAEEQQPAIVKGFPNPIRNYKIVGFLNELAAQGRVININENGIRITLNVNDLSDEERKSSVEIIKDVLSKLS
jgi:class 3 adenylate cyclase/PAS domain-containing protein